MDIGTNIGTYTIILCESFKNDRIKFKLSFMMTTFVLIFTIFQAGKGT